MEGSTRKYDAIGGSEAANIYRDKLRTVELEQVRLDAGKIAGEDVDKAQVDRLNDQADKLRDAIRQAEDQGA